MFDENFNSQKKQEDVLRELNLIFKMLYKSTNENNGLLKGSNPSFQELVSLIEANSMVKSEEYITKKVN